LITLKQKLTALKESIDFWELVSEGKAESRGRSTCALCTLYNRVIRGETSCEGCPIFRKTGEAGCEGTPYVDYVAAKKAKSLWLKDVGISSDVMPDIRDAGILDAAKVFLFWLKDLYIEVSERESEEFILDLKGLFHQEEDYAVGVKRLQDAVNELNKTKPNPDFVGKIREAEKAELKDKQDKSLMPIWTSISQLENKIKKFEDSHNFTHTQLEGKCDAIWERVEDIGNLCEERLKKVEEDIQLLKHHKEATLIELDHHARAIFSLEELNKK